MTNRAFARPLAYRPEIDGLRALAIVPVVLYHAAIPGFGGGFVGVDVFFVISGYLITGIIVADLGRDTFSIARFYERRARRILPALGVVVAAASLAAWVLLIPLDFRRFAQALAATGLFGSNLLFTLKAGYFDTLDGFEPLLHTWSLAVEEQFYLLYPALLAFVWRRKSKAALPLVLAAMAASFVLAVAIAPRLPQASFYLLPTRAWELMAGAACALLPRPPAPRDAPALAGLVMIAAGIALINPATPAPGLMFLLPVGGTALVLVFAGGTGAAARLLGLRPFVSVGLASYGIYLWHQPLLAFLQYTWVGPLPLMQRIGAILAAFALGYASLIWIERPVRRGSVLPSRRRLFIACAAGLAIAVGLGVAGQLCLLQSRVGPEAARLGAVYAGEPVQEIFVPPAGQLPFVLFGDSEARQYYPAMAARFGQGALVSGSGCMVLRGVTNRDLAEFPDARESCWPLVDRLQSLVRERKVRTVLLAYRWDREIFDTQTQASLGMVSGKGSQPFLAALDRLRIGLGPDVHLVLLGNVPTAWSAGPQMNYGMLRCRVFRNADCPAAYPSSLAEASAANRMIAAYSAAHANVSYLDTASLLCRDGMCQIMDNGRLVYADGSHLTPMAARRVVAAIPATWVVLGDNGTEQAKRKAPLASSPPAP